MNKQFATCTVAAAPLRIEASHRSEMVNQLLFGEMMEVLEEKDEWLHIRTVLDQYEGWLTSHLVTVVPTEIALTRHQYIASGLINAVTLPDQLINIPMGSILAGFDEETRLLWDPLYKYHGTFRDMDQPGTNLLRNLVQPWINAPYLWGGKTFMGVDCSGFVQTVFRVMGILLPRDAWQQQQSGAEVRDHLNSREGDLAFFQNETGRITHVGIMLEGNSLVHASGKVRIDRLDEKGIIQSGSGKRTHHFHSMKRYF